MPVGFERDAALDGITLLGSIKSALLVNIVRRGSFASERAADIRSYVRQQVQRRIASRSALSAAIVSAVLIGDRSGISQATRQAFVNSGVAHVLAVSGSNVAVVAGIFMFIFGLIRLPGRIRTIAVLAGLLAV